MRDGWNRRDKRLLSFAVFEMQLLQVSNQCGRSSGHFVFDLLCRPILTIWREEISHEE